MKVHAEAEATIPGTREAVFDRLTTDEALSRLCLRRGPFAAIQHAETHGVLETGARRTVTMSDGMVLEETIVDLTRPERHVYEWRDPPLPLGALIRGARGSWTFREAGADTRVTWSYALELRSAWLRPLGALLVPGFRGWMQAALDRARAEA